MNEENIIPQIIEQKESIKLVRNTKGYNWEIKILEINIDRLNTLNKQMEELYGKSTE